MAPRGQTAIIPRPRNRTGAGRGPASRLGVGQTGGGPTDAIPSRAPTNLDGKSPKPPPSGRQTRRQISTSAATDAFQLISKPETRSHPIKNAKMRSAVLSNNHVLANEGVARLGDVIVQPGTLDGGSTAADAVAGLLDFTPLKLDGANVIDAGIANLYADVAADQHLIAGFGPHAGLRPSPIDAGEDVIKVGRTSGLTRGKVSAIEIDDLVADYEMGSLRFDRQTEIEGDRDNPFSQGGDSGSLVIDQAGRAFGLVFSGADQGGSNGKGLTYANDLGLVLSTLDLTLDI